MKKQTFDVNTLRVAAPCSVGWETVSGDERVRLCHSCNSNIYNIAEMTKPEIETLITNREDRICIRLYKRADGTVLTKDCPVGLRAYYKKTARFAGAALATILGLFSISFGQKSIGVVDNSRTAQIIKTNIQNQPSSLSGVVEDQNGAIIPNIKIVIYKEKKKKLKFKSDEQGVYKSPSLSAGTYTLEAKSNGFMSYKIVKIDIKDNEQIKLNIILQVKNENVTVGIFASEPLIDMSSTSITTTIKN